MKLYDAGATCKKVFEFALSKGWSDSKLARVLNVTPQAVNKWRKGVCSPSIDTIVELTGLFQVSMDDLVCYNEVAMYYEDDER